ncbi:MAG: carboxymuconolactone decarboxylase family protein [Planctomycetaceae bacterium]
MLELDGIYRGSTALDPKLRAKIRWTVASANRCGYGMAYAVADLRAAGADEEEIAALQSSRTDLPARERARWTSLGK